MPDLKLVVIAPPSFEPLAMLPRAQNDQLFVSIDPTALREAVTDADVVFVGPRMNELLQQVWTASSQVRWVHAMSAGVETLLFDDLCESAVAVTNGRGAFASALAEFTAATMLHFAKDVPRLMRNKERRSWEPFDSERLEGKTVGIIGYGSIGQAVGRMAASFGMRIAAFGRRNPDIEPFMPLDQLLRSSDFVIVSVPLTPSTRGLLGAKELSAMKSSAVLVNIGRGPIIEEAALIDLLRTGRLRGAALDVFDEEPLPAAHPFWSMENVLISPHSADHVTDSFARAMEVFLGNLERFRQGQPLLNLVDKRERY